MIFFLEGYLAAATRTVGVDPDALWPFSALRPNPCHSAYLVNELLLPARLHGFRRITSCSISLGER